VRLGDLTLLAACGGLGNGGSLGATCGFDTFCRCGAGCFFGLTQSTAHRGVGVFRLMRAGSLGCVTRG